MNKQDLIRAIRATAPEGRLKTRFIFTTESLLEEYKLIIDKKSMEPTSIRNYIKLRIATAVAYEIDRIKELKSPPVDEPVSAETERL